MKKSKILYIIIFLIIILIGGHFIKKHFDNQNLQGQIDELDTPSGTQIDDNNTESNDDLNKLKIKGYILSIDNGNVDLNELLKKTNLENKTPVYTQLASSYNSAIIVETNQKIGPIYLVNCKYDKQKNSYSINKSSKQLISEFIQNCDVLVFLDNVNSDTADKAILVEKNNKTYYLPLESTSLNNLSGKYLKEIN